MIAEQTRRSPLAGYTERFASLSAALKDRLIIREIPFLTQINLRADPSDRTAMETIAGSLGFELPQRPNTVNSGARRSALWLGPDEWLIVAPPGEFELSARAGGAGSVVDVSANRTAIALEGSAARELLLSGCAIDLHPRAFGPGRCAQTMLAKAQVIIQQPEATPGFHVYVRASFASYLADWLLDAGNALWTEPPGGAIQIR